MMIATVSSVLSTFHRETAMREEYAYRLPLPAQGFLNAHPHPASGGTRYIAFTYGGYHIVMENQDNLEPDLFAKLPDDLSFTSAHENGRPERILVERALSPRSQIVDMQPGSRLVVDDARDPMVSSNGRDLTFIRDNGGRGRLMERTAFADEGARESALTAPSLRVYEASFLSDKEYSFSAVENGQPPEIYLTDSKHRNSRLDLGESRYPAISPDRRWMAYSRFEGGGWNLWLRDQQTGTTRRISDVPCNQIQPMWEEDSKTLLYGTDCGRNLWFTAIARRKVIP
jgi:hypothetical protein